MTNATNEPEPEFIGVREVAERLQAAGIQRSEDTIRNWILSGTLPAMKLGARYVVARSAVDTLIAAARTAAAASPTMVAPVFTMQGGRRRGRED